MRRLNHSEHNDAKGRDAEAGDWSRKGNDEATIAAAPKRSGVDGNRSGPAEPSDTAENQNRWRCDGAERVDQRPKRDGIPVRTPVSEKIGTSSMRKLVDDD